MRAVFIDIAAQHRLRQRCSRTMQVRNIATILPQTIFLHTLPFRVTQHSVRPMLQDAHIKQIALEVARESLIPQRVDDVLIEPTVTPVNTKPWGGKNWPRAVRT